MRKLFFPGKMGKIYTLGIFLVCGLLLGSAEECEDISMADQQAAWARAQAAQSGPDQQAAWAQSQASQSGPDQAQAFASQNQALANQSQASQAENTGASQAAPAAGALAAGSDSVASGSAAGGSQAAGGAAAASGPAANVAPAASGSQAAAGAQGDSGAAQGQQQSGADSQSGQSGTAQAGGSSGANQSQAAGSTATNFLASISGKEWKLSELRLTDRTIALDRAKLNADGAGDIFTLAVEGNRISGKAAPNRYNTVYQAGENNTLTLSPVVSTLMAASFDPERIQEHEYYQYLSKVKSWRLNQNRLELNTTDASNKEAVLVYVN